MANKKRKILALAAKLGATVGYSGSKESGIREIAVDAPPGSVWRCNGCHGLVACDSDGGPWEPLEVATLADLSAGLMPCDDPDCETCH